MRRIGIMGGTFNPIHNGHLAIAAAAREQFFLEKVLFMPSGVPYMKDQREVLPIQTRCEMTALAIADMPYFELSELETEDAMQGRNTYTCDTLQTLRLAEPDAAFYFILGADSLYAIEDWKEPALIFESCTILAAVRKGGNASVHGAAKNVGTAKDMNAAQKRQDVNFRTAGSHDAKKPESMKQMAGQAQQLREKYDARIELLEFAGMDISSTQIRERVQSGASIHGLVPKAVEAYMESHRLYR